MLFCRMKMQVDYEAETKEVKRKAKMEVEESYTPAISHVEKTLYGGAIICLVPENGIDASTIREIPDHQEVFCNKNADQSIIFDILEYETQSQGEKAPRYHFLDIASTNDAADENQIQSVERLNSQELSMTQCHEAWYLSGLQKVSKFDEGNDAKNLIEIQLGLFRLPNFGSDIVVTMNSPIHISANSSSHKQPQGNREEIWSSSSFKNILTSLEIIDTSLFA